MNVLVTGGAGFIGSHLVEALVERGRGFVRVADNLSLGKEENLSSVRDKIDFRRCDLLDDRERQAALQDVETVFHEAAIPSVPRSIENPVATHLHGAHATLLLLDDARRAGVKRFIFAASSSAYGDVDAATPKEETLPMNPLSPYAATKAAGELYVKAFARCYAMDAVALRYFNVFGPRQDPHSPYSGVIARFCTAFRDETPVRIFGDGEQSRDFTFVENVVRANLAAADVPGRLNGRVVNVGCGERTTLNRLASLLVELSGRPQKIERVEARSGDVKHSCADLRLARTLLGYEPRVRFAEGLEKTWAWYCNA